jgi:hypothetical protein
MGLKQALRVVVIAVKKIRPSWKQLEIVRLDELFSPVFALTRPPQSPSGPSWTLAHELSRAVDVGANEDSRFNTRPVEGCATCNPATRCQCKSAAICDPQAVFHPMMMQGSPGSSATEPMLEVRVEPLVANCVLIPVDRETDLV